MRPPFPVERVPDLPRGEFRARFERPQRPVVLAGLADAWPARSWTLSSLAERFGDVVLPVLAMEGGRVRVDPRRGYLTRDEPLGAFLADLDTARDGYVTARVDALPPALRAELREPAACAGAGWRSVKLWISPTGTVSALHFDLNDNVHTQLIGRKRFTIFPPSERANLYPQPLFSGVPNGSRVDLDAPDLARFPRLAHAQPWIADLSPGDALYLPRRWWHHVRTVEASVSTNTWWARGAQLAVATAAGAFKRAWGVSR